MVSREQKVSQSVEEYLKGKLTEAGYGDDSKVHIMESWDGTALETPLTKNYIATGYSFDNGGQSGEVGSNLINRLYTIELLIFAMNMTWGRNLASVIQTGLEEDEGLIPLLDIGQPGQPRVDTLMLEGASAQREPVRDGAPAWQRYVWMVRAHVRDEYYAALV